MQDPTDPKGGQQRLRPARHAQGTGQPQSLPSPAQDPFPQVGAIGDEEEWVSLYEEENEPDAQMLEIPNLTPYTHYR